MKSSSLLYATFVLFLMQLFLAGIQAQTHIETYIKTDSIKLHGRFVKTENDSVFIKHKNKNGDSILQAFHLLDLKYLEKDLFVKPVYLVLGCIIGYPGILNILTGYMTESYGVRAIGGYNFFSGSHGLGLDLTYSLSNRNNYSSNLYLRGEYSNIRLLNVPVWRYISNYDRVDISTYKGFDLQFGFDVNWYGFYLTYSIGYGNASPFNPYLLDQDINGNTFLNPKRNSFNIYGGCGYVYEFK